MEDGVPVREAQAVAVADAEREVLEVAEDVIVLEPLGVADPERLPEAVFVAERLCVVLTVLEREARGLGESRELKVADAVPWAERAALAEAVADRLRTAVAVGDMDPVEETVAVGG